LVSQKYPCKNTISKGEIMSKMHYVQIILDHELLRELAKNARRVGTSISEIIRASVKEWLTRRREQDMMNQRLEDLQVIENHRQEILARRGRKSLDIGVAQVIEQMRIERTNELVASVFPKVKDASRREDSDSVLPSSL
jgi:Lhr-like helicase